MRVAVTLFLVSGLLCLMALGSVALQEEGALNKEFLPSIPGDEPLKTSPRDAQRIPRQVGTADSFSLIALGVFSAFVKYIAYHFITKNSEGGGSRKISRSLEDNLLDLTRITSCLTDDEVEEELEEEEEDRRSLLSNFHLHCFFPTYFNREDNDIISTFISGGPRKNSVGRPPAQKRKTPSKIYKQRSRTRTQSQVPNPEEMMKTKMAPPPPPPPPSFSPPEGRNGRVRRNKPAGTVISLLSLAAFGAFFFYFAYYNITKYMSGGGGGGTRSLASDPMEDYLMEMTSILQCLREEDFAPRFHCFVN